MIDISEFVEMFACDTARISRPTGRLFLIIGLRRNTKDDPPAHGKWFKNGEPFGDFDYIEEHVIASGQSETELMASAKAYKEILEDDKRNGRRGWCA